MWSECQSPRTKSFVDSPRSIRMQKSSAISVDMNGQSSSSLSLQQYALFVLGACACMRKKSVVFYSTSTWLTMQTAVLARPFPSVCLSVCHSVTFRCFVQTNEDRIVRFSASGSTIPLVSEEIKLLRIFVADHTQRGC